MFLKDYSFFICVFFNVTYDFMFLGVARRDTFFRVKYIPEN